MTPRVAIDLTAVPRQKGGVGYYLVHLVEALQAMEDARALLLILSEPQVADFPVRGHAVRHVVVPALPAWARLVWEQLRLPHLLRRHGVDVLHSPHYTRPLRRLPCASVVGLMDMTFFLVPRWHLRRKRLFFRAMIPAAARRADRLLAISESTRTDVIRCLGIQAERIDVTPLAASARYTPDVPRARVDEVRSRYRLPNEYVLFVGTAEPRKNLARLLAAYDGLQRRGGAPPLVLAGARGWHDRDLEAPVAAAAAAGWLRRLGYVPDDDLPALYRAATAFVYPSLYEGFGLPVLEALACGVPTLTSDVSSMPEVAGDAAVLVNPTSIPALTAGLERLLADPELRGDLAVRGPRRAARFSWAQTARATLDCYDRAFAAWRSAGRAHAATT